MKGESILSPMRFAEHLILHCRCWGTPKELRTSKSWQARDAANLIHLPFKGGISKAVPEGVTQAQNIWGDGLFFHSSPTQG